MKKRTPKPKPLQPPTGEIRARILRDLRHRAPTPSGVYGCKCEYCERYFGGTKPDQRFCSFQCNTDFNKRERIRRQRKYDEDYAFYQHVMLGDVRLSDMTYTPSRSMSDASDPRASRQDADTLRGAPTEDMGSEEEEGDDE